MAALDCREIEARLPWFVHGGLPPEERGAIEAHLPACVRCREALAATHRASALYAEHLSPEMIVDYALGLPVQGVSRGIVDLHLVHCSTCREEFDLVQAENAEHLAPPAGPAAPQASQRPATGERPARKGWLAKATRLFS